MTALKSFIKLYKITLISGAVGAGAAFFYEWEYAA